MRILDDDRDQTIKRVILYLTESEALELLGGLTDLLQSVKEDRNTFHIHVSDNKYEHEISLCLYKPGGTNLGLSSRSQVVIDKDL